ncbi:MAG: nuclease [Marmoricola sp.]|jgi:hypothetical protein|nr:nuclease [Marmoricola sp.]
MPLVLDHNLRNTKQIHSSFGPLAPTPMTSRGGDGAEVHFIPAATDAAVEVADEAVGVLLDVGRLPGNIALVTTASIGRRWCSARTRRPIGIGRGRSRTSDVTRH